jgi:P-type Ca2+ transporter type 2C
MSTDADKSWHLDEAGTAVREMDTDLSRGLTAKEAQARLESHGENELPEGSGRSVWRMVFDQFTDFMIIVLIAAAVVSGIVGDPVDTIAIVVIVVLNAIIGVVQEWRAEQAMAALREMAAPSATVRRDGRAVEVSSTEVVPGDIVLLEAGDVVPADLRLVEAARLTVAEAALTGESQAVDKATTALSDPDLGIGDRSNMAWKGTTVGNGRGVGVTVATGLDTELGRIAQMLESADEVKTPLQKRLAAFGARLAWVVLAISAVVFIAGILRGEPVVLMFLTAVSLAVAAIPEALPAVVTISLALGARRMIGQNTLIRRLPAVETLGSVTYICTDKTGTLTQNRMRVETIVADGDEESDNEPWRSLFRAMALSNDARIGEESGEKTLGDPTEIALLEAAADRGFDKAGLEDRHPRRSEIPFDSDRKRMSTVHDTTDGLVAYVKGAPEAVLGRCHQRLTGDGHAPFDSEAMLERAEEMAADGLRVLAVAQRELEGMPEGDEAEQQLTFLGLVGLIDPPRPEAAQAVAECRTAGIVPVMITGDHPSTARAIADRLGILEQGEVVTGTALSKMSDDDLANEVLDIRVYARVDPEQKIRIVRALQAAGQFTAMTGDGVNDAPALKRADIGVAMGEAGTDVAREASHMVLLDDNFATIVHAIREGRRIFDNIRRFIKYTMTSNSGEIWTIFLAPFLGLPIPLLPIHILWINLVTDGLPGLALAAEKAERDVMDRPPRRPNESIFSGGMWQHILVIGLLMGAVVLGLQAWAIEAGSPNWQSMVFTALCLSQLGHVLAIRSERDSVFTMGFTSNKPLLAAVVGTFILQLATLYVPVLNPIFETAPLGPAELAVTLAASAIVFLAVEAEKAITRRRVAAGSPR